MYFRGEHGAELHPQVLGVGHDVHPAVQPVGDDPRVEVLDHLDEVPKPRFLVGHVEEEVLVAAQVAELEEGVPVPQAAHVEPVGRLADAFLDRRPVDRADAGAAVGVGRAVAVKIRPVGEGVAGDGAGHAVHRGRPDAAKIVTVGRVLAGDGGVIGAVGERGLLEAGEEEGVVLHQPEQLVLRVILVAGRVYGKRHGDVVRPLKADGAQVVFPAGHGNQSFQKENLSELFSIIA